MEKMQLFVVNHPTKPLYERTEVTIKMIKDGIEAEVIKGIKDCGAALFNAFMNKSKDLILEQYVDGRFFQANTFDVLTNGSIYQKKA